MSLYNHGAIPIGWLPSRRDDDLASEHLAYLAAESRNRVSASDLLAEVQDLLLAEPADERHPLWPCVVHWADVGTSSETGRRFHGLEQVGAAFEAVADRAIVRLVQRHLDQDVED